MNTEEIFLVDNKGFANGDGVFVSFGPSLNLEETSRRDTLRFKNIAGETGRDNVQDMSSEAKMDYSIKYLMNALFTNTIGITN